MAVLGAQRWSEAKHDALTQAEAVCKTVFENAFGMGNNGLVCPLPSKARAFKQEAALQPLTSCCLRQYWLCTTSVR